MSTYMNGYDTAALEAKLCKLQQEFLFKQGKIETKPLLVLLGPTASGKTALSLDMAKRFNCEIISADSRQVYRYMNIGTDKIPVEKREGILHHLLDVVTPDQRFTVSDFKKLAEEKIEAILGRGKIPLVVGGTGLYLRALTENFEIPETGDDLSFRKEIEEKALHEQQTKDDTTPLKQKTSEILHEKLKKLDPESAQRIHPHNLRYIVRALEIFYLTGKRKSDRKIKPKYRVLKIGLMPPLETLDQRIHRRVDEQFEQGLVEEVKNLLAKGYHENLPAMHAIGYRELIQACKAPEALAENSLENVKELIKTHTRQFARKQIIWFRREKNVSWLSL